MKEVKPGIFQTPDTEPTLRVGIVLEEDRKRSVKMRALSFPVTAHIDGNEYPIEQGSHFTTTLENNTLSLALDGETLCKTRSKITLSVNESRPLAPQAGTEIQGVVAGRSFHWKKEIDQICHGSFSVHPAEDGIIVVNHIPFEDYLSCVIASEMSAECPESFIQAQVTAARSWASVFLHNKHSETPYTICNDDDCQRYQGTTHLTQECIAAAKGCRGDFLVREDGSIVPTYYSKSCGGRTETAKACFDLDLPYLSSIFDGSSSSPLATYNLQDDDDFEEWLHSTPEKHDAPFCSPAYISEEELPQFLGAVDEPQKYYRWNSSISSEELRKSLQEKFHITASAILATTPGKRGASGRYLSYSITYRDTNGEEQVLKLENQYQIRQAFHDSFLFSSAFLAEEKRSGDEVSEIIFSGGGWGHGVGLCQIGALGMALDGKSYEEIVRHYFPKAQLKKGYA